MASTFLVCKKHPDINYDADDGCPMCNQEKQMKTDPPRIRRRRYVDELFQDALEYADSDDPSFPAILIVMALYDVQDQLAGAPETN